MSDKNQLDFSPRRTFLGKLVKGGLGLAVFMGPILSIASKKKEDDSNEIIASNVSKEHPSDKWFKNLKGTHRVVYDVPKPNELMPFAWPRVFLLTNNATGSPESDCGVMVVFRHYAIPYVFHDQVWSKYKLGEMFKANDPVTNKLATRNPFWKPKPGDLKLPGVGDVGIGINELQASGVLFCVCDVALTVYSAAVAEKMNLNAAEVKKDWLANLLPNIEVVPSGVWALGRAQEHGCQYIFAG